MCYVRGMQSISRSRLKSLGRRLYECSIERLTSQNVRLTFLQSADDHSAAQPPKKREKKKTHTCALKAANSQHSYRKSHGRTQVVEAQILSLAITPIA